MRLKEKLGASLIAITSVFGAIGALHPLEAEAQEQATRSFDIPPGDLTRALQAFAEQSDRNVLFTPDMVAGKTSPGVQGQLTERQALEALLAGSGLRFEQTASNGYTVQDPASPTQLGAGDEQVPSEEIVVTGSRVPGGPVGSETRVIDRDDIETVGRANLADVLRVLPSNTQLGATEVVEPRNIQGSLNNGYGSGVNLRGLGPDATLVLLNGRRVAPAGAGSFVDVSQIPLTAVERVEVVADGASAIYGSDAVAGVVNIILRRDYEGFETALRYGAADGFDQYTIGQTVGANWNSGSALLSYEHFNRSNLSADDRDFYTDNLTALGGLDLRTNASNPGTILANSTTYAIPSGQDGTSLTAGQLVAGTANLRNQFGGADIVPEQARDSILAVVHQDLTPSVSVFFEGLLSARDAEARLIQSTANLVVPNSNPFFVSPDPAATSVTVAYAFGDDLGNPIADTTSVDYNLSAGFDWSLTDTWSIQLAATRGRNELDFIADAPNRFYYNQALADSNPATAFNPFGDGSFTNPATLARFRGYSALTQHYTAMTYTASANGTLFTLPAGDVRVAVGGETREEEFYSRADQFSTTAAPVPGVPFVRERNIDAVFGEIQIPIFSQENGLGELIVSGAVRAEDYSDFGEAVSPKFGLRGEIVDGLRFRASYDESFKAPILDQLRTSPVYLLLSLPNTASPTGFSQVIFINGRFGDLQPQEATTQTFGLDWVPEEIDGLRVHLTYFTIEYENRIQRLSFAERAFVLNDPAYASRVVFNPSGPLIQSYYDSPQYFGASRPPYDQIFAIVEAREQNAGVLTQSGVDLSVSYTFDTPLGEIGLSADAAWNLEYEVGQTPTGPRLDLLDTIDNPSDFQMRAGASLRRGDLTFALAANYVGEYENPTAVPTQTVDAWITFDGHLGWDLGDIGPGGPLRLTLDAQNLLDEEPPSVAVLTGYDANAANALGRMVSVGLTKRW